MLWTQGSYRKASEVKAAADALWQQEMGTTLAAYDSEVCRERGLGIGGGVSVLGLPALTVPG